MHPQTFAVSVNPGYSMQMHNQKKFVTKTEKERAVSDFEISSRLMVTFIGASPALRKGVWHVVV